MICLAATEPLSEGSRVLYKKCLKGQSRQENLEVILNTLKYCFISYYENYMYSRVLHIFGLPGSADSSNIKSKNLQKNFLGSSKIKT